MSANPSLYADAFSASRSPSLTFHAASTRIGLARALTADLASYYHARAEIEDSYVKQLTKLQQRLHGPAKDSVFRDLDAFGLSSAEVDKQLGQGWAQVRRTLENEVGEVARVHEQWRKKAVDEVERPLEASLQKGSWAAWNAAEQNLTSTVKEYEGVVDKVQKAQQKSTRSGKSASSKLLTSQSHLSTLGSQLTSSLPAFLTSSQKLDLAHAAVLKEALTRAGTLTSDLGRERMEGGERVLVQVLSVDESAEAEEWALREGMKLGGSASSAAVGAGDGGIRRNGGPAMASGGEFGEAESVNGSVGDGSAGRTQRERQETQSDAASTRSGSIAPVAERQRTNSRAPPAGPISLPTTDDARSTKESKSGLGGKLSSLLGGSKSRDRSSSIPNSAKYANFNAPPEAPPVPPVASSPSLSVQAPAFERSNTQGSGGSDLLGGSSAGGPPPLQPTRTGSGSASAAGGNDKRKSLMPGGAGSLFRRQSKMVNLSDDVPPSSPPPTTAAAGGNPQFAGSFSAEPLGAEGSPRVDSEGFSVPPEGYDRQIGASAGAGSGNLMDDDDEPLGESTSTVPRLSIAPTPLSLGGSSSPSLVPQESESARLAALEAVKSSLGAPASGLSRRGTARGRRSETGQVVRPNTVFGTSALEAPKEDGSEGAGELRRQGSGASDDDVPLAVVQQQQQQQQSHRRAPPPPPTASSVASISPPTTPASAGFVPPALSGPAAGRTMSVLSASSSLASSSALHPSRPDPFAGSTSPGLRAEVRETVNVLMKAGEVTRVMVAGEVGVSYRGQKQGMVKLRLTGLDQGAVEKTAPNAAFLVPSGAGSAGEFTLNLAALSARDGATTPVLKYQLALPPSAVSHLVPLVVKPTWRCEPSLARAIVAYSVNRASPLLAAEVGPFGEDGEEGRVEDVKVELHLASGTVSSFQTKPAGAALLPNSKGVVFSLPSPLPASAGGAEEKLLASLQTSTENGAPAQPAAVGVTWTVRGRTVGRVGVEVEDEEGEGVVELRRETVAGKCLAA
ncbi:hypothetical protein JCM8097_006855 [Rhodosporidiobolus ruineniae]